MNVTRDHENTYLPEVTYYLMQWAVRKSVEVKGENSLFSSNLNTIFCIFTSRCVPNIEISFDIYVINKIGFEKWIYEFTSTLCDVYSSSKIIACFPQKLNYLHFKYVTKTYSGFLCFWEINSTFQYVGFSLIIIIRERWIMSKN